MTTLDHQQKASIVLIFISSIGLALAVIPEVVKVIRQPKSAAALSPYFLAGRATFFLLMGIGFALMVPKDARTYIIIFLSFWYIAFYSFLFVYYMKERKRKHK